MLTKKDLKKLTVAQINALINCGRDDGRCIESLEPFFKGNQLYAEGIEENMMVRFKIGKNGRVTEQEVAYREDEEAGFDSLPSANKLMNQSLSTSKEMKHGFKNDCGSHHVHANLFRKVRGQKLGEAFQDLQE